MVKPFKFKHFSVHQSNSALKVGTDAMLLGALVNADNPSRCLDIGTGNGVIALMLAQKFPNTSVVAVEPDDTSLIDCKQNFLESDWNRRMEIVHSDIQNFNTDYTFDLIVSNPPFYENSLLTEDSRSNGAKHASEDQLKNFFLRSQELLTEKGEFWIILPSENHKKWISYATEIGLSLHIHIQIEAKPTVIKRCVLVFGLLPINKVLKKTFLLRTASNEYSSEYKELTKEFHFNKL